MFHILSLSPSLALSLSFYVCKKKKKKKKRYPAIRKMGAVNSPLSSLSKSLPVIVLKRDPNPTVVVVIVIVIVIVVVRSSLGGKQTTSRGFFLKKIEDPFIKEIMSLSESSSQCPPYCLNQPCHAREVGSPQVC